VQLLQDSAICRLTSFCDLPCRLSFPHSAFYPPFRRPFRIFEFRTLLSAFRNSAFYQYPKQYWILWKPLISWLLTLGLD